MTSLETARNNEEQPSKNSSKNRDQVLIPMGDFSESSSQFRLDSEWPQSGVIEFHNVTMSYVVLSFFGSLWMSNFADTGTSPICHLSSMV